MAIMLNTCNSYNTPYNSRYIQMGSNGSRVLGIKNIQEHLNMCELLGSENHPVYGQSQCVRYKEMDFNIAYSLNSDTPHPLSIHYLALPNYLLFPSFELLQHLQPSSLPDLLSIVQGVCEMAIEGGHLGVGYGRIAHNGRWGVVGELPTDWAYQRAAEGDFEGVFLSPQQMISLSQGRPTARCDPLKADVFALGLMLVQIIFMEEISFIYDYDNFEIRLNPLLEKLQRIKEEFGEEVASLFVGMLEIQEEDRYDFEQLASVTGLLLAPPARPSLNMLASNSSQRNIQLSRGQKNTYRTPKQADRGQFRNDVSPFRGRFGGAAGKSNAGAGSRRTPDRAQVSRSPMRRQGGAQFGRQVGVSPVGRR